MLTRAWSSCGCHHFADGKSGNHREFPPVRGTNNIPELAHPQIEALPRAVRAEEEGLPPLAGCCAPVLDRQPPASPGARASDREGAEAPAGWRTVAHAQLVCLPSRFDAFPTAPIAHGSSDVDDPLAWFSAAIFGPRSGGQPPAPRTGHPRRGQVICMLRFNLSRCKLATRQCHADR